MKSTIVCTIVLIVCLSVLLSCSLALFFNGQIIAGFAGLLASLVSILMLHDVSKDLT